MPTASRVASAFFFIDSDGGAVVERHVARQARQRWHRTIERSLADGVLVGHPCPHREIAMDRYGDGHAFLIVFLALFGLLFFV
jgi:hypothetical protein